MRVCDLVAALVEFAPDTEVVLTTYVGCRDKPADCVVHNIQEVYYDDDEGELQIAGVYEPATSPRNIGKN